MYEGELRVVAVSGEGPMPMAEGLRVGLAAAGPAVTVCSGPSGAYANICSYGLTGASRLSPVPRRSAQVWTLSGQHHGWRMTIGRERVGVSVGAALVSIVMSAALRALPTQLDLFTAVVGGGAVGGIVGGAAAWLFNKDLAQGGVLGGVLGMILGALLAILQSSGLYS